MNNEPTSNYITNYNGQQLTVDCQQTGATFTHSGASAYYSGNMWDYVHHAGKEGYLIGYLVATPRQPDWQNYVGLPLWKCG